MSSPNESSIPANGATPARPAVPDEANRPDWERLYKELVAEREKLLAELAESNRERDSYRQMLLSMIPVEDVPFTKDEVFAQIGKGPSFLQFLDDLERELST